METQPPPALPEPPPYKLFSIVQIGVATFLGSPLPGMWMVSENLKRLGQRTKASNMLLAGIGLTVLCFGIAFILPDNFPAMAVSIPFLLVVMKIARMQVGKALEEHAAQGGQIDSWGKAIGYGLAGLVIVFALIFGAVMLLE